MSTPSKAELRRQALQRRAALPKELRQRFSEQICSLVLAHPWVREATIVHSYCSFGTEVDTHTLCQRLLSLGKRVAVPIVVEGQPELLHAWLRLPLCLRYNRWGIPEPDVPPTEWVTAEALGLSPADVAIVPVVAYDRQLYRLGYGQGYYDRFLRHVQARRIGLAFSVQAVESIPHAPHDVRLDAVITESGPLYADDIPP
ncbi:MAG: 5-formyltetrahydrofolate cyclo-ligase [Candidatus Kapabacteria bacterium]|nr:5-formyltetrahydrofolate cyclo-ligase [Candidatus Kapabacteria bacterium]MDW8011451.1 5-formyltetrahydrofolate cyclo-ligase [Bacteroidota bacterium]